MTLLIVASQSLYQVSLLCSHLQQCRARAGLVTAGGGRVSPDPGPVRMRSPVTAQAHWLSVLSCVCDVRVITRELLCSQVVTVLSTTSQHIVSAGDIKVGHPRDL